MSEQVRLDPRLRARAEALDVEDPLASYRRAFVDAPGVQAYLDGNSLGRPLQAARDALNELVDHAWGTRLIRAWDEEWMEAPTELGDTIGRVTLGAEAGQTVVADSTTVLLYKLIHVALALRPGRTDVVLDRDNFPTDRFVLEGIAAARGLTLRWITPERDGGVSAEQVAAVTSERTALVLLSAVAYKSGHVADIKAITDVAHRAGAVVLWDLCHAVGAIELAVDDDAVDLAVGCTYKYLNGGPGAPAFGYVAARHHGALRQPIQGWMGAADPFAMDEPFVPASGIRRLISGTPPVLAMVPMRAMLELIDDAGMPAVRTKSRALTAFAVEVADELLLPYDVRLATPRDPARRGSHITLEHPDFRRVTGSLWERGVIPDFRPPHGIRVGLSPLSTSFTEVAIGLTAIADELP
ncbi:kynureninase [Nocardioides sp. BGMRC 2183]|nr:kynureninase [Nocardioides sp. BGMRC 2183]